jgi:hypothetical protein
MHILILSLEKLDVIICLEVEWFPEGGLPSNLKSINIYACDKLVASQMGWGLQNLPFLELLTIVAIMKMWSPSRRCSCCPPV